VPDLRARLASALREEDGLLRLAAAGAAASLPLPERAPLLLPLLDDPRRAVRLEAYRGLTDLPDAALPVAQRAARVRVGEEFLAAARHNADQPEAVADLADVMARQGRLSEAEASFCASLRLEAGYATARLGLAEVLRGTGRETEAEGILREGVALAPDTAALHHALGLSLVRQRRVPQAMPALARAVELDPGNARYAYVYAIGLRGAGRFADAIAVLDAALRRSGEDRTLLLGLALLSRDAGDLPAARRHAERALALNPRDAEAQALLRSLTARP
jgi:tetratricopeptide (TPR) repeat protein